MGIIGHQFNQHFIRAHWKFVSTRDIQFKCFAWFNRIQINGEIRIVGYRLFDFYEPPAVVIDPDLGFVSLAWLEFYADFITGVEEIRADAITARDKDFKLNGKLELTKLRVCGRNGSVFRVNSSAGRQQR
jgi:hypothetical protein